MLGRLVARCFTAPPITITADGALPITLDRSFVVSKTSAAALTVAAPGDDNVGRRIRITGGTDFAHIVTFTGGTLWDGTAGANTTWTSLAVQGSSIMIEAVTATKWNVIALQGGTVAP